MEGNDSVTKGESWSISHNLAGESKKFYVRDLEFEFWVDEWDKRLKTNNFKS